MRIAAKYPDAREAQLAKLAEVQEQLAQAFAQRLGKGGAGDPRPHLLAGLTLTTLSATFRMWFHTDGQNIEVTADRVLEELDALVCDKEGTPVSSGTTLARPKRTRG